MRHSALLYVGLAMILAAPAWGHFADPTATGEPTIYLGKIPVTGQKNIVETLQAIKVALKTPFSSAAADANVVVCRINKAMSSHAQEYLDCATNRDYTLRRDATQTSMLSIQNASPSAVFKLQHIVSLQPERQLHMPVSGGNLQKLLETIPLPAPAASTAPESGGGSGKADWIY